MESIKMYNNDLRWEACAKDTQICQIYRILYSTNTEQSFISILSSKIEFQ